MALTEKKINKILDNVWTQSLVNSPSSIRCFKSSFSRIKFFRLPAAVVKISSTGQFYKVIRNKFVRVYKKYDYKQKGIK